MLSLLQAGSGFIFLMGVYVLVGLTTFWWLKFMIFCVRKAVALIYLVLVSHLTGRTTDASQSCKS